MTEVSGSGRPGAARAAFVTLALTLVPAPAISSADTNTWMGLTNVLAAFSDPTLWSLGRA